MWDRAPEKLTYQNLNDQGKVISLKTQSGNLGQVKITWEDTEGGTISSSCSFGPATSNNFPDTTGYACGLGIIRATIFPFTGTRASLIDGAFTAFLRPNDSPGPANTNFLRHNIDGPSSQGSIVSGGCSSGDNKCSVTIRNLPTNNNFIYLKSIYKKSNVTIEGLLDDGVTIAEFSEGQIEIDATARANDIIKRIKVSVPKRQYDRPGYSTETMAGICKELETYPSGADVKCSGIY